MQPTDTKMVPARDLITGGFSKNSDLISYIVSGLLLGLFFDWIFGTRPIMIILGTLAGLAVIRKMHDDLSVDDEHEKDLLWALSYQGRNVVEIEDDVREGVRKCNWCGGHQWYAGPCIECGSEEHMRDLNPVTITPKENTNG